MSINEPVLAASSMRWGAASGFPAVYEELNVPGFFDVFTTALLDRADPQPGERMLDVATGTGIVARRARERCPSLARIVGLDLTPGMLAIAREMAAGADAEFVEGDAGTLAFEHSSFDLVTCQQGLQFFPARPAAVAGIHRVLAPGGRAVIATWCELESSAAHTAFTAALDAHLPELAGPSRNPFALAASETLLGLLDDAGFVDTTVERVTRTARFASAEAFVRSFAEGSPMDNRARGGPRAPARDSPRRSSRAARAARGSFRSGLRHVDTHRLRTQGLIVVGKQ